MNVVANTPLVSIDLIVKNEAGQVLLGRRTNQPAKGYWFVPGGRILKNERLDEAFLRLSGEELGFSVPSARSRFLGVYEHLYPDSSFDPNVGTHYVVLGYELITNLKLDALPKKQHNDYQWFKIEELLASHNVHANTKAYF